MEDRWLYDLKYEISGFLRKIKGKKRPGFFHYSLSGDYWGENIKWGLGNSVFFLKIIYTLGLEKEFEKEAREAVNFIKSFQRKNGEISDVLVYIVSLPFLLRSLIQTGKKVDFLCRQTRRAETRQAFCALGLFGEKPELEYGEIPKTEKEVKEYLEFLDWEIPWGAGSHFSHLLFFLSNSALKNKNELIDYAIRWIAGIQKDDGFWYQGDPGDAQKINGAMKVITGLKAAHRLDFEKAEKIIDLCLKNKNDRHACDNFNIAYVIKYCFEKTDKAYRADEIKEFMVNRLSIYRQYYHKNEGGFSFKKNKANRFYYGALISRGKNEPDIHGSVMFLWGISIVAQVLDIDKKLGVKEFLT